MTRPLLEGDEIRPCSRCEGPRVRVFNRKGTRLICRRCKAEDQKDYYHRNSEILLPKMADYARKQSQIRPNTCGCGCGTPIGKRSRYARGHNGRIEPRKLICRTCEADHSANPELMVRDSRRRLGRADICLDCIRRRTREIVASNRATVISFKARPCADCGLEYPHYVMDCDHRDPSQKTMNVSSLLLCSAERVQAELEKCDVVCANCHRERTHQRRTGKDEP